MAVSEEIQRQVLEEATSATRNFEVDTSGEKFQEVDKTIANQEAQLDQTYNGIINNTDQYYNDLKDATQQWADKQTQIQQDNTDFTIEKIEQQKDQAHKDYLKEQSGAYVDWQKQSNKYGTEAEKIASAGLSGTGFSESSQVSMYNTYQNRVATARESFERAKLNYDNAIKDAQLQNNAALAEIAATALQKQLELSLEGFQYKNQLVIDLANKKQELENTKWNRYQDILQQINTENALKWEVESYYDNQKWQEAENQKDRDIQLQRDELNREFEAKQAELDRKHDLALVEANTKADKELADYNYNLAMKELAQQHKNDLEKLDKQLANDKALLSYQNSLSGGGSKISGGSSGSAGGSTAKAVTKAVSAAITGTRNAVNTAYYQGAKNSDAAKYGTFSNGYQPKGISGHGTLSKTGDTITFNTKTLSGQKQTVTQNIWKAKDDTKWYWDGRYNKYIQVK